MGFLKKFKSKAYKNEPEIVDENKKSYYSCQWLLDDKHLSDFDLFIIYSSRNDGKSFSILYDRCLTDAWKRKKTFVYLRQMDEDFKLGRAQQHFDGINNSTSEKTVHNLTDGEWDFVEYYSRKYYWGRIDEETGKTIRSSEPIGYCQSISQWFHNKSTNISNVGTIFFDEFMQKSVNLYLYDEFNSFKNCLSSIIRRTEDVKVFMCGNSLNPIGNPYFENLGILDDVINQENGTLLTYKVGRWGLKVAVERPEPAKKSEEVNKWFSWNDIDGFGMITEGKWDLDFFPSLPDWFEYDKRKIKQIFFVSYKHHVIQCEIIRDKGYHEDEFGNKFPHDLLFIYCHKKTTEIKGNKNLVFCDYETLNPNEINNFYNVRYPMQQNIAMLFNQKMVRYQDNWVGSIVNGYLTDCRK